MGANCYATPPLLKAFFFDYRFDLINFDPSCQNLMGAICHITPVLNDILDLCRFDLTYLTPHPQPKFFGCILSRYTTAIQPISIQPLQTQQKPHVTEAQHNAEKHFLFKLLYRVGVNTSIVMLGCARLSQFWLFCIE